MAALRRGWEDLEPAWLSAFLAVAERMNYTRAARAPFLAQPAVSRQMQALQRSVGLRMVEQVDNRLALAGELLDGLRSGTRGRLRVGAARRPASTCCRQS